MARLAPVDPRGKRVRSLQLPLRFVEHQRLNITGTVYHANDDHLGIGETVVQHVIAVKMCSKACDKVITAGADLRMRKDG